MEPNSLDSINRNILEILSNYGQLTPLQWWYELGEDEGGEERVTEEEILSRLDALMAKGFVERITRPGVDGDSAHAFYRVKSSTGVVASAKEDLGHD